MFIKFKKLHPDAVIPSYQTTGAAGMDLHAVNEITIQAGEHGVVETGLAMQLPFLHAALLFPRSGNAAKHGITLSNAVAVIDSDFRGEVKILLHNAGHRPFEVKRGDRVAQMLVLPYPINATEEVDELDETERGVNGFGSTGN
jgi:dUTP pyrophosphatase